MGDNKPTCGFSIKLKDIPMDAPATAFGQIRIFFAGRDNLKFDRRTASINGTKMAKVDAVNINTTEILNEL